MRGCFTLNKYIIRVALTAWHFNRITTARLVTTAVVTRSKIKYLFWHSFFTLTFQRNLPLLPTGQSIPQQNFPGHLIQQKQKRNIAHIVRIQVIKQEPTSRLKNGWIILFITVSRGFFTKTNMSQIISGHYSFLC